MNRTAAASFADLARFALLLLCATACACLTPRDARAQDRASLARELVDLKGGYVDKKRRLEDLRVRAYVPYLVSGLASGRDWNPQHRNWQQVEAQVTRDWVKLNHDYQQALGRDVSYTWFDAALAREYAARFDADALTRLIAFHRSAPGRVLLDLERELLEFHPRAMADALASAMVGAQTLSGRASELFATPELRARRDFIRLFEAEGIIREESFRAGGTYAEASYPTILEGALTIAGERIDALAARLAPADRAAIAAFVASPLGRSEREFIARTAPVVLPAAEDPVKTREIETAFFKQLEALTATWRKLVTR